MDGSGADGNDKINAGQGDDILSGGDGSDKFQCGSGNDEVTDFNKAEGDKASGNCENVDKGKGKNVIVNLFLYIFYYITKLRCEEI